MDENIEELNNRKAVFVVNHSGGKDSQAMYLHLRNFIPPERLIVIHADLPGVDWEGIDNHIKNNIGQNWYEVVRAKKTFFEMVKHRQMWPSPSCRQCTSDLKRGPIEKAIRRFLRKNGKLSIVVNCMGMRAEESSKRAKMTIFSYDKKNSKAGREWYKWLPIHKWSEDQVFWEIKDNLQKPHWAYAAGMTRLSCCFCIMSSAQDLKTAARLKPELFQKYCEMEKSINHTFVMPNKKNGRKFLPEIIV